MDPTLSDGSILCAKFSDGPLFYLVELEYFSHSCFRLFFLFPFFFSFFLSCFFFFFFTGQWCLSLTVPTSISTLLGVQYFVPHYDNLLFLWCK